MADDVREYLRAAQQAEIQGNTPRAVELLEKVAKLYTAAGNSTRALSALRHARRLDGGERADLEEAVRRLEWVPDEPARVRDEPEPEPDEDATTVDRLQKLADEIGESYDEELPGKGELVERGPQLADPSLHAWCSFCCRPRSEVGSLVAGAAGAFVCSSCTRESAELLGNGDTKVIRPKADPLGGRGRVSERKSAASDEAEITGKVVDPPSGSWRLQHELQRELRTLPGSQVTNARPLFETATTELHDRPEREDDASTDLRRAAADGASGEFPDPSEFDAELDAERAAAEELERDTPAAPAALSALRYGDAESEEDGSASAHDEAESEEGGSASAHGEAESEEGGSASLDGVNSYEGGSPPEYRERDSDGAAEDASSASVDEDGAPPIISARSSREFSQTLPPDVSAAASVRERSPGVDELRESVSAASARQRSSSVDEARESVPAAEVDADASAHAVESLDRHAVALELIGQADAIASVDLGLRMRARAVALLGAAGTGKTTFLRALERAGVGRYVLAPDLPTAAGSQRLLIDNFDALGREEAQRVCEWLCSPTSPPFVLAVRAAPLRPGIVLGTEEASVPVHSSRALLEATGGRLPERLVLELSVVSQLQRLGVTELMELARKLLAQRGSELSLSDEALRALAEEASLSPVCGHELVALIRRLPPGNWALKSAGPAKKKRTRKKNEAL